MVDIFFNMLNYKGWDIRMILSETYTYDTGRQQITVNKLWNHKENISFDNNANR